MSPDTYARRQSLENMRELMKQRAVLTAVAALVLRIPGPSDTERTEDWERSERLREALRDFITESRKMVGG